MKIINRKNIVPILCCTYTVISLCNAIIELFFYQSQKNESLNSLGILGMSFFAIVIFSYQKQLKKWNIWLVMLIQYITFIASVIVITWITGFIEPLHPDAYWDMFFSGTFFYIIGAVIYYISFFLQIRKENQMLQEIQDLEKKSGR